MHFRNLLRKGFNYQSPTLSPPPPPPPPPPPQKIYPAMFCLCCISEIQGDMELFSAVLNSILKHTMAKPLETQNYTYWYTNFCLVTVNLTWRSPPYACFLICMCQNSVADGQIHTAGDQKRLILPYHAYQSTGGVTHCQSVLTNCIIRSQFSA